LGTWYQQEWAGLDGEDPSTGFYGSLSRAYNPPPGRWLSPDPAGLSAADPSDPQTWNAYAYAGNNPTTLTDPTGLYICGSSMTESQCDSFAGSLTDAQNAANVEKATYGDLSSQYLNAQRAIDAYGDRGVDNGVTIQVGDLPSAEGAVTSATGGAPVTADNPNGQNITVTFNTKPFNADAGSAALAITSAHEGSHVADASDWVSSGFSNAMLPTSYATESRAFGVSAAIAEGSGAYPNGLSFGSFTIWQPMWNAGQVQQGIDQYLGAPRSTGGIYQVTPAHPGSVNWRRRAKPWWLP
jgi:RHS repeat-associated protein